ncbi:anoctamin-7-like [Watersipora subatra]|uniref:anoctamin-7-like n=1 Tax=Watersipora subatra TaxID=2589382 RepID=UPI00355AF3CE
MNKGRKELPPELKLALKREKVDYVILHKLPKDPDDPKEKANSEEREKFEQLLEKEGFLLEHGVIGQFDYCKMRCSFERLCKEAESVKLEMPLKSMWIEDDDEENIFTKWIDKTFETDNEVDYVSAPFTQQKLHLFKNSEHKDLFFRSSLRSLLTEHILKNLDMRKLSKVPQFYYDHSNEDDDPKNSVLSKKGLPYLLMKGIYTDSFILHDESEDNYKESQKYSTNLEEESEIDREIFDTYGDPRHVLNITWPYVHKFQPLWKIRNYFGEEIALYFAWAGLFITTLMIPMIVGLLVFTYGMYCSISHACINTTIDAVVVASQNETTLGTLENVVDALQEALANVKEAFDNNASPVYALGMCIWSTIFLELWKRKNAVLAYEWDVNEFENVEPDRPEHFGTDWRNDPVTKEKILFYPFKYKLMKFAVSLVTFIFMLAVVFSIMISVILYRVFLKVDYCTRIGAASCFMVTTVCSSLLNAIAILLLGKFYEVVAVKLTDWENHRTASAYRNALIIKLFAFQFANSYSSLYYIAFFRDETLINIEGGLFGLGETFSDYCAGSCMPDLGFQVLTLLIIKPLPRIFKDIILPWAVKKLKTVWQKKKTSVDPKETATKQDPKTEFLEKEMKKPPLKNFTLNEYTEKTIQYGFLVLFAPAMPLGPIIVILFNTLDRVVDSKRLLWMNRRPVATIAQNIGMWQNILEFLNIAAVITNGFLIAFTSDWGKRTFPTTRDQLLAVIVFEHAVFLLKFVLSVAIPDVPHKIRIAMRKEKFTVAQILETGVFVKYFAGKPNSDVKMSVATDANSGGGGKDVVDSVFYEPAAAQNIDLISNQQAKGDTKNEMELRRRALEGDLPPVVLPQDMTAPSALPPSQRLADSLSGSM